MSLTSIDHWIEQYDEDPLLVLEVEASARWGVSHGHFLDWPAEEVAKSVALIMWERKQKGERCSMCGTRPDDWLDPETKWKIVPPPFVAEWENCEGCSAIGRAEKAREKNPDMDKGMRVVLQPNPEASAEE